MNVNRLKIIKDERLEAALQLGLLSKENQDDLDKISQASIELARLEILDELKNGGYNFKEKHQLWLTFGNLSKITEIKNAKKQPDRKDKDTNLATIFDKINSRPGDEQEQFIEDIKTKIKSKIEKGEELDGKEKAFIEIMGEED
jgi:hypothetical protein